MKEKGSTFIFILLIIIAGIIVSYGIYLYFKSIQETYGFNSNLGQYKLYYNSSEGLISRLSNGDNKEILFKGPVINFELINDKQQALLIIPENVVLANLKDKSVIQLFSYTKSQESICCDSSLSPNKRYYFFTKADWQSNQKSYYIIDLDQRFVENINFSKSEPQNIDFDYIKTIFWSNKENRLLLIAYFRDDGQSVTTGSPGNYKISYPNKIQEYRFIEYDIKTKTITLLGKQNVLNNDSNQSFSVPPFVDISNYDINLIQDSLIQRKGNYSYDKTKIATIRSDAIYVNDQLVYRLERRRDPVDGMPIIEDLSIKWLPDNNHLLLVRGNEIRIIETDTKKVTLFDKVDISKISGSGHLKIEIGEY